MEAARSSIFEGVRRIGLPAPIEVDVALSCMLSGTATPRAYPRVASGVRKLERVLVHVRLRFAERVRGPILLGAGRYQGLGLCLPVDRTLDGRMAALAEPRAPSMIYLQLELEPDPHADQVNLSSGERID